MGSTSQRGNLSRLVRRDGAWAFLVALVAFAVFSPTLQHDFAFLDDYLYVERNYQVHRGLNIDMIRDSVTSFFPANWHPVTLISHALDCSLYGVSPTGHHATNLVLHSLVTAVLFLFLRRVRVHGARALVIVLLFALHPLQVETVAWIASRKGLLSTLFVLLAVWAHAEFASGCRRWFYLLGFVSAALAMASKSMAVTLPLLLLIVDYWPLDRWQGLARGADHVRRLAALVLEKVPYALLSLGCVLLTLKAHGQERISHDYSWLARVANAFHSCIVYVRKAVWPADLSVYYPHPGEDFNRWLFVLNILLVVSLLCLAWKVRRSCPAFTSGWLWYLVSLLPVLGLIPIDGNGWADRYAYLPLIGLFWAVLGMIPDRWLENRIPSSIAAAVACLIVLSLAIVTSDRVHLWQDSETLFGHALMLDQENPVAHVGYAAGLVRRGELAEAERHIKLALASDPQLFWSKNLLAGVLVLGARYPEAERVLKEIIARNPDSPDALGPLAWILVMQKRTAEAVLPLKRLVQICPRYPAALHSLGRVLTALDRAEEALPYLERAAQLEPDRPSLSSDLARARLAASGRGSKPAEKVDRK